MRPAAARMWPSWTSGYRDEGARDPGAARRRPARCGGRLAPTGGPERLELGARARERVRRGVRPWARQHAGRLGHGAQSLLENLTQISGRPVASGRRRQLLLVLPAGHAARSPSQSRRKSSSAKPFRARACHWSSGRAGPRNSTPWSSWLATMLGAPREPESTSWTAGNRSRP